MIRCKKIHQISLSTISLWWGVRTVDLSSHRPRRKDWVRSGLPAYLGKRIKLRVVRVIFYFTWFGGAGGGPTLRWSGPDSSWLHPSLVYSLPSLVLCRLSLCEALVSLLDAGRRSSSLVCLLDRSLSLGSTKLSFLSFFIPWFLKLK